MLGRANLSYGKISQRSNFDSNYDAISTDRSDILYIDNPSVNSDFKTNTSFSYHKRVLRGKSGRYSAENTSTGGYFYLYGDFDTGTVGFNTPEDLDPDLYSSALSRLYDKFRGDVDLSIDLAQSGRTASMVKKFLSAASWVNRFPKQALQASFNAFHHGISNGYIRPRGRTNDSLKSRLYQYRSRRNIRYSGKRRSDPWRDLTTSIKHPASLWLEYTYGVAPTLSTLYGAVIEVTREVPPLMKVSGSAKKRTKIVYPYIASGPYGGEFPSSRTETVEETCLFKCQFLFPTSDLQLISRFTSLNPISIGWELMPYSFVFDWFVDVGGYLRNLETSLLSASLFGGGFTLRRKFMFNDLVERGLSYIDSSNPRAADFHGWARYTKYERLALSVAPFPRAPRFKADLSSARLLNAAALLSNFLGSKR